MSTFIVPHLGNPFPDDFDKLIIGYIETNYNIADPVKTSTDYLRFASGFFDYNQPYEITVIEQDTRREMELGNGGRSNYMSTLIEVNIRMQRLSPNGVDPQLGAMEREVIRIIGQYRPHNITGISVMTWEGTRRIYSHMIRDEYAETDWRTSVLCRVYYEYRDVSP